MVIWIILTLLLAHNQPSSATTFSIPQNAKVYIKESELHLWNPLSFAFKTNFSGILLQQPEFINFQDFVQLVLTDTGHLQLKWRYKGQSGILGLTSGQTNLADGSWHVISFAYQDYSLNLKIDNFNVENITSLAKTPSLFSVRVSQQDSRVVVGQSVGGDLCFQTGPLLGHRKFWIAEGNVSMSNGSVDNCESGNLRSADFGLTDLGSCPGESGQTCNGERTCYLLDNIENCACPEGTTGVNCDESIQPCDRHYCEHEGECKSVDNIPICDCNDNYSGDFCEIHSYGCRGNEFGYAIEELNMCYNKSGCYPNSCKNKGTCEESESSLLQYTCDCPTGFSGHDCEINLDDCQSDSCSGNGICVDMRNDFVCYCNAGWKGAECAEQFDVCTFIDPCLHGNCINILIGSEADGTDQPYFECECDEGWTGRQCEENVNECDLLAPCENGATCSDNDGSYECLCSLDWTGKNCTENVNRCLDNDPCGQFGTCQDELVGISCLCDATHSGDFCIESICSPNQNPCQNGAECILEDDNYSCNCTEYFEGEHCAEWKSSLCDGPLVPTLTAEGYDCVCPEGYEGDNCDSIKNCQSSCRHGTCKTTDRTICDCDPSSGYEGVLCDENIDNCHPDPCNGGTCQDEVNSFKCFCPFGFTGSECETNIDECFGSPCNNSGTCQNLEGDYQCTCVEGYSGKNCEVNINECDPDLCLNGGTCHNLIGRYECDCSGTGYTGSNCQSEINECAGQPCQNGGTCTDEINSFTCDCSETGFEGDLCEVPIDECVRENVICYHGGECRDKVKGFKCDCNEGFSGTYCQVDFPDCEVNPCKNGGTCLEVSKTENYPRIKPLIDNRDFDYKNAAGFACECAEGFEGSTCEEPVNYCELETNCVTEQTSDCVNKSPSEGYYSCECKEGFEGDLCQTNINDCEESHCQNNANCTDGDNDYSCQCTGLFAGKNCSIAMTGCDGDDCQNGGKCQPTFVDNEHGHQCECTPGYTGNRCQTFTDLNLTSPFTYNTGEQNQYLDLSLRVQTTLSSMTLVSSEFFRLAVDVTGNLEFTIFGTSIKSEEAISHGEWVDVVVKYENLEATLRYKDKNCVDWSESSSEVSESETFSFDQITVGSDVDQNETSKFVGCVEDFKVNTDLLVGGENGVPTSTSQCERDEQCHQLSCNAHGTCVDLWTTFECQCFDMYAGQFCGQEISAGTFNFENSCGAVDGSWAEYKFEGTNQVMEISFHVRTVEDSGLIYQHGNLGIFEIMVKLVDSKLFLRLGEEDHSTDVFISDGKPHKIILNYGRDSEDNEFRLLVDESFNHSWKSPKNAFDIDLLDSIAFNQFKIFFNHQKVDLGKLGLNDFKGCLSDIRATVIDNDYVITKLSLRFSETNLEIGGHTAVNFTKINCIKAGCRSDDTCQSEPCVNDGTCAVTWNDYICNCTEGYAGDDCENVDYCNSNTCHEGDFCMNVEGGFECHDAISFDGPSSYVNASASDAIQSDSFSTIQLTLRTRASESFLFFIEGTGGCYASAQLKAGNFSIHFKFDQQSNAETVEVDKNLADGNSNVAYMEFSTDNKVIVKVNDVEILSKTVSNFQQPTIECVASQRIFIGGLSEQDMIQDVASKIPNSPPNFDGCISNFRINDVFVPLYTNASSSSFNNYSFESSAGITPGCSDESSCLEANCNFGTCRKIWRSFECDCQIGFEGDECGVNIDDCVDHKCENERECLDGINKYTCHCGERYKGQYCEEDVDECEDPNFCSNGGVCVNSFGSFSCDCPPEWTGDKCDVMTINTLTCVPDNPCNGSGDCVDAFGSKPQFRCSCFPGFEGVQCERELDLCADHPCKNAHNCTTKIDKQAKSATYVCVCIDGFSGDDCTEQEVAETCEGYDCNGRGQCEVLSNEPICRCNSGFRGLKCQDDIDECLEGEYPCTENNTIECLNTAGSYECICVIGWTGEDCGEEENFCEKEPCLNGGNCTEDHSNQNRYTCSCEGTGFQGPQCEEDIKECQTNPKPCENGVCEEPVPATFSCNCGGTGFYGDKCEKPCKGSDGICLNNATCEVSKASSNETIVNTECKCAEGFEGDLCESATGPPSAGNQFVEFAGSGQGIAVFVLLGVIILLMIAVILLVIIIRLKKSRAKSGLYQPRVNEREGTVFQIPVDFQDLRPPKEERLI